MKLRLFLIFTLILILFTQLLKSHITYMFVFILHIKINWDEKGNLVNLTS